MPAGDRSYFGFDYQIYASVLIMLLRHQSSDFEALEVETDFGNDATVTLQRLEAQRTKTLDLVVPGKVSSIHVQVKTKIRTDHWQPNHLREVLLKRDETSLQNTNYTLLDRLIQNPDEVFLFVTNGTLHIKLSGLLADIHTLRREIPNLQLTSIRNDLINSVRKDNDKRLLLYSKLTVDVLKRVFVASALRIEEIKRHINELLNKTYGIPAYDTPDKAKELADLIHDQMLRVGQQKRIDISELENIVGKPGLRVPFPDLEERFVPVPQYHQAIEHLKTDHFVIITGEPCVGKTTVAYALINFYAEKYYRWELVKTDSHLEIMRACANRRDTVFLLNDAFGAITYDAQNAALGNQFSEVIRQLQNAKGRVKVIVTSRSNILNQTISHTRMSKLVIDPHIISLPFASNQLRRAVLEINLPNLFNDLWKDIESIINFSDFENLLHVYQFATTVISLDSTTQQDIQKAFDDSRPSAYDVWIERQSDVNRLFMYVLWIMLQTSQFTRTENLDSIFMASSVCFGLPEHYGPGTWFDEAYDDLVNKQNRIDLLPDDSVDFVHPRLGEAVGLFLENSQVGFKKFVHCLVDHLKSVDNPLHQSIAAMLCLNYYDSLSFSLDMLQDLIESPYIETKETIVSFCGHLLDHNDKETRDKVAQFLQSNYYYTPYDCEIDDRGFLVSKFTIKVRSASDGVKLIKWKYGLFTEEDFESELLNEFANAAQIGYIRHLNPMERFKFGNWLFLTHKQIPSETLSSLIFKLSNDPISFVRKTTVLFFQLEDDEKLEQNLALFHRLCYDNSPSIKIEMLERVILRKWRFQLPKVQKKWIEIAIDMLDNFVVRAHAGAGLLDMSGSYYWYHAEHSPQQKKQWFISIAPKLIKDKFHDAVYFDRFLSKFEEYFDELPTPYRTQLLKHVDDYIENFPWHSEHVLYTVKRLTFRSELNEDEKAIVNRLIRELPDWARIDIIYAFAQNYQELPDQRFCNFVHRPFYNEAPDEYVPERVAAILGFLNNDKIAYRDLPVSLQTSSNRDVVKAIRCYVLAQDNNFKRLVVLMAHGYKMMALVDARRDNLYRHKLVLDLIKHFAQSGNVEDAVLVATVVLCNYDFESFSVENHQWIEQVNLFLYNDNVEVCKRVCEIIFASNLASSVHPWTTFLNLVFCLLNHPQQIVQDCAFRLLDENFTEIWSNFFFPHGKTKTIIEKWFSDDELLKKLYTKSRNFRIWSTLFCLSRYIKNHWEILDQDTQQNIANFWYQVVGVEKDELLESANNFYARFQPLLPDIQQRKLQDIILMCQVSNQVFENDKESKDKHQLEKFFPKFDWSIYFE